MLLRLPRIIRTNLIILLIFVVITNVDGRPGGRGRAGRLRVSKLQKNKFHLNSIHRQSSLIRKPNNHILAAGGGAALVVGTLALRSFVSNNNKGSIQSRQMLTDGTGSLCINRENYSNFIFNEFRCPLSPIFPSKNRYCCGAFHQQYCCSFWESGVRAIGTIVGIIFACTLFILSLICCIVYCRRYCKQKDITEQIKPEEAPIAKQSVSSILSDYLRMRNKHLSRWFYFLFTISLIMVSLIEGKGFSGGRGGGGFKGGSSKGSGTFGGAQSHNRANSYGNTGNSRSRGSFKNTAVSFAAGAAGGIAAYSLMRSMSGSHSYRPGHYGPGYGVGETCVNNENLNGTVFGQFRCPLNGFPYEAKHCCGDRGHQFCCIREGNRFTRGAAHFGWIVLVIIILLIVILLWARRNRRRQKEMMMIPTEPPVNEQYQPSPFYQPAPPAAGYPPPPGVNPYGVPPQNFNPYAQQSHMPYPPQQQPYQPY